MNILVLGGNGFIGSHLVAAAVNSGHRVTVFDLSPMPRFMHGRPFKLVEVGSLPMRNMSALLSDVDVVCHLASNSVPATSNDDPTADITDNLLPSVRLLEAMREAKLHRIIYLSSGGAVYGLPQVTPIAEDHPLNPISAYGVIKVAFEKYLGLYAAHYGLRPTIIRPSNPYGPGQGKIGIVGAVTTFLSAAASGEVVTIWGDGSYIRDFIHIDDLCRLLVMAIQSDKPGTYNCGFGLGTSVEELLVAVERVTGKEVRRIYRSVRASDPPAIVLDIVRAQQAFGWNAEVDLDKGLLATWNWMEQARQNLA